jgi:hypothetical protein
MSEKITKSRRKSCLIAFVAFFALQYIAQVAFYCAVEHRDSKTYKLENGENLKIEVMLGYYKYSKFIPLAGWHDIGMHMINRCQNCRAVFTYKNKVISYGYMDDGSIKTRFDFDFVHVTLTDTEVIVKINIDTHPYETIKFDK